MDGREKWDVKKKSTKQKNASSRLCENEDVRIEGGKKKTQDQWTARVVC